MDTERIINQLPPKSIFPKEMPRYPNVWFLVDERLVLRGHFRYAIELVVGLLERELGLRDTLQPNVENRNVLDLLGAPREGADFEARLGPFHEIGESSAPGVRNHCHQVHARFYVRGLVDAGAYTVRLDDNREERNAFTVPASVHYEVATEDPLHPYVDECPLCGITGEYAVPIDRSTEEYCLEIHEPLGVEYLCHATIRSNDLGTTNAVGASCLTTLRPDGISLTVREIPLMKFDVRRMALVLLAPQE